MLILADADGSRLYLHQLGQGILKPTRYGDSAALRNIQIREFFARNLGRGVN